MLIFNRIEVPTEHGPAVLDVSGALHRVPAIGPAAAAGVIDFRGQHARHSLVGQVLHAYVPAAEFVAVFPEWSRLVSGRPWALVPVTVAARPPGGCEHQCRMDGLPTFGDPAPVGGWPRW